MEEDTYERLARHISAMGMGMPYREELVEILRENFTPTEAEVVLSLPSDGPPLEPASVDEIAVRSDLSRDELELILEGLAERGLIYSRKDGAGGTDYGLHGVGFGFPQSFFWKGEDTPHARKMTRLVLQYFNRSVTTEAFGGEGTKPYRYIPVGKALKPDAQAVYPHHLMDLVIDNATTYAVAHCPCRVEAGILGKPCGHPLEVCLKFDEMAEYLIDRGLGRRITRQEARKIVQESAEVGLVHFVDNAVGGAKHNCNCCGCACWNVGSIRRRKIPRDLLMAVYFLREPDPERCVGCGECVEICPVQAVTVENGTAVVDQQWCIGCGVCAVRCDFGAVRLERRSETEEVPRDFHELHATIRAEKGER